MTGYVPLEYFVLAMVAIQVLCLLALPVQKYKQCQILTPELRACVIRCPRYGRKKNPQPKFTCCTSTKVQNLTCAELAPAPQKSVFLLLYLCQGPPDPVLVYFRTSAGGLFVLLYQCWGPPYPDPCLMESLTSLSAGLCASRFHTSTQKTYFTDAGGLFLLLY